MSENGDGHGDDADDDIADQVDLLSADFQTVIQQRDEVYRKLLRSVARSMFVQGWGLAMEDIERIDETGEHPQSREEVQSHLDEAFDERYDQLLDELDILETLDEAGVSPERVGEDGTEE